MALGEELEAVLASAATEHGVPGAMAGVLVDGECHTAAYGVTNVEHPLPVDSATLFQIASLTKTFTATAVMLLVDESKVALEDPVAKHLPDLAARTAIDFDAITVEHLLSHQAGFDGDHLLVTRETDSLDALRDARRLFPPGSEYSYNNAAFSIAGALVGAVSGDPFESFVQTRLLGPLGMDTAAFRADDVITHRVAAPHFVVGDTTMVLRGFGWQPGWELGAVDRAAGGLIASVDQLLRWCRFQLAGQSSEGEQLIAPESLDRLHTPVVRVDAIEEGALDWSVWRYAGGTAMGHGGLTVGYCSNLVVAKEHGVGVVTHTHAVNGAGVNQAVRRWALERCAGIIVRDPEPDPAVVIEPGAFAGEFVAPFARLTLSAGEQPNTITLTSSQRDDVDGWKPPPDAPMTLAFFRPDHAVTLDASGPARVARFAFDADGRVDWLLWGGRRAPRTA
jgi:CubicO group peptidase (beta-lactamase class C family)